jgi:hypothetical protein
MAQYAIFTVERYKLFPFDCTLLYLIFEQKIINTAPFFYVYGKNPVRKPVRLLAVTF